MATLNDSIHTTVVAQVCSFDLAQALTVEHCSTPDEANRLLQDGWILLVAGIDANGFPLFILADPSDEWRSTNDAPPKSGWF